MKRILNPELDRYVLDALATRYKLLEKREGMHLSTLNYCLTKGYFEQRAPIEPTDTELLNFATGYGLQELMFPTSGIVYEVDGVIYRPDGVLKIRGEDAETLVEIKSTRSGVKRYREGDLPETWITYMKGGCYMRGTYTYDLSVIYLSERPSAKIISETIIFDPVEVEENWNWIIDRRDTLKEAFEVDKPPAPFTTSPDWMCDNCRYHAVCNALVMMEDMKQADKNIKELWL